MELLNKIPPKVRVGISTSVLALSIYVLGQVVGAFAYIATVPGALDSNSLASPLPWQTFVIALSTFGTMLFVLILVLKKQLKTRQNVLAFLRLKNPNKMDIFWGFVAYAVYFVIMIFVIILLIESKVVDLDQAQDIGFDGVTGADLILVFFTVALLAPIVEEVLFRGFLYNRLKKLMSPVVSAIAVSLLFGLAHGQLNVAIDTFVLSIVMIFFYEKSQNLFTPILVHSLKNTVAFVLLFHDELAQYIGL